METRASYAISSRSPRRAASPGGPPPAPGPVGRSRPAIRPSSASSAPSSCSRATTATRAVRTPAGRCFPRRARCSSAVALAADAVRQVGAGLRGSVTLGRDAGAGDAGAQRPPPRLIRPSSDDHPGVRGQRAARRRFKPDGRPSHARGPTRPGVLSLPAIAARAGSRYAGLAASRRRPRVCRRPSAGRAEHGVATSLRWPTSLRRLPAGWGVARRRRPAFAAAGISTTV